MASPLVSVIIPVHNGAAEIADGINSMLAQTFTDFELIVVDDGSTDGTAAIVDGIGDARLQVIHQENAGVATAANRAIGRARGRYLARLDHDDLARPARLEQQVRFMEENPGCAVLGTSAEIWIGNRPTGRIHCHPTGDADLRFDLLFDNPFVHSSVMLRKSAVDAAGSYRKEAQPADDYDLISRLARKHQVANLPECLTIYRERAGSISRAVRDPFREQLVRLSAGNIAEAVGEPVPGRPHQDLAALMQGAYHRVSPEADLDAMSRIVRQAAATIAAKTGRDLSQRLTARLADLRHHHRSHRYAKKAGLLWPLAMGAWRYSGLQWLRRSLSAPRP